MYKFNHSEEKWNGADFEWWIGSSRRRWAALRFQAKKLSYGSYRQFRHEVRVGVYQHDLLIRQARRDRVWPMYCLYNGWPDIWPAGVPTRACPGGCSRWPPTSGNCSHMDIRHFGCSAAPAVAVIRRFLGNPRRGRLTLQSHLPHSKPWSHLFEPVRNRPPGELVRLLPRYLSDWYWQAAQAVENPLLDKDSALSPDGGVPAGDGLHDALPSWLDAKRRNQEHTGDEPHPKVAVVIEVGD
ncbi:DUF6615 family protein [Actinoplanes cyaneus]|uniref:DUF6615 family protein n=1 Tax=Actinoplanes cyaneus TaxID=52696 RepID=UPI0034D96F33